MTTEKDLKDRRVKIVGAHPHAGKAGTTTTIEKTLAGWGLKVALDEGGSCLVFRSDEIEFTDGRN